MHALELVPLRVLYVQGALIYTALSAGPTVRTRYGVDGDNAIMARHASASTQFAIGHSRDSGDGYRLKLTSQHGTSEVECSVIPQRYLHQKNALQMSMPNIVVLRYCTATRL